MPQLLLRDSSENVAPVWQLETIEGALLATSLLKHLDGCHSSYMSEYDLRSILVSCPVTVIKYLTKETFFKNGGASYFGSWFESTTH